MTSKAFQIASKVTALAENLTNSGTLNNVFTDIVNLSQQGSLSVITGTARWYSPHYTTVSKITCRLATAADDIVTVVIKKSGQTQSTIQIPSGDTVAVDTTGFNMTDSDYLTVDLTTVGTVSQPGTNLNVQLMYVY